jgi:hypothetical protein
MTTVPFATLVNKKFVIPSTKTQYTAVQRGYLVDLLKPTLSGIYVDAEWYLRNNPDIAAAIEASVVASAEEHYVAFGFYEHRMPYEIQVDETWYLAQYPDVDEAVAKGIFKSARDHFYRKGFQEGRMPYPAFAFRMVGSA